MNNVHPDHCRRCDFLRNAPRSLQAAHAAEHARVRIEPGTAGYYHSTYSVGGVHYETESLFCASRQVAIEGQCEDVLPSSAELHGPSAKPVWT